MFDLGSPITEPESIRMKFKVMYFCIAICVTLMLENCDLKIGLQRCFTIHVDQPSAQGGIQYAFCNCQWISVHLFWRFHRQYNAAFPLLSLRQFFPIPNLAFPPEMYDTPLKEIKTFCFLFHALCHLFASKNVYLTINLCN